MLFNLENYKNTKIILTDKYLIFIGPLGILKRKTNFYNINIIKGKLLLDNTNYNQNFEMGNTITGSITVYATQIKY